MGRARVRGRLVAACAVLAAAIAVTPAGAAPCADHVVLPDRWTMIPAPAFAEGNVAMTTYDVGDVSPRHLVVTNGRDIVASQDGGCTWTTADLTADRPVPGPDLPLGDGVRVVGQNISQVRFAAGFSPFVWAIGQSDVVAEGLATSQPRVLFSPDFGQTFGPVTAGLAPFGRPIAIRGFGERALLLMRRTVPVNDYALYEFDGTAWTEKWTGLSAMDDFVVDTVSPPSRTNPAVWLWNTNGAYTGRLSDDAPRLVRDVNGNVRTVDLLLSPRDPAQVTVYFRSAPERAVSRDGGVRFTREPAPLDVQSASSFQLIPGVRAISSLETNVLIEAPTRPAGVDFSPREYNVSDVQFVATIERAGLPLYAFHATALFLRHVPLSFQPPALPPVPVDPEDPVDVDVRAPSLGGRVAAIEPRKEVVRLRTGQSRVVDYQVQLPPVPTPLDVFFMTDSTGSMDDTIASVQYGVQDIVDGLAATGISVYFGVADFRDYKSSARDPSNYPYKRRRAIGPIDTALAEALESITTGGGNNTGGHDAGLEAIYQAATGAGRPDPLVPGQYLVEPGYGAQFRPEAMKVVLVATDDNFRHADPRMPTYPVPAIETVSAVLKEKGIYLVGLEVDTNSGSAREDMERLARDTGAVAPDDGIDCDGDGDTAGYADVLGGDPIVCAFDPDAGDTLADAFIGMLSGIKDYAPVDIAVRGPAQVVRAKGKTHFPKINVKAPSDYRLPVEFRCTDETAGTESTVRIAAMRAGREVVATTATVECVAPRKPEPPPPIVPPAVVAALVPPPPPPPAPVPQVNPNINPNINPNPNPQVNANSGFAAQEEQEIQLAVAGNDFVYRPEEDYAMTGLDRSGPPVPALAWAVAFAMTGAAAYGMHLARRERAAPAYVRNR